MKFISKTSNYLVVLSAGLAAQPITGTPAKPTISVRFKDGVAEVTNEDMVKMMLAHPGFNGDFISAEGLPNDPYAANRISSEPAHVVTELKYGTPISKMVKGGSNPVLPPELQKIVTAMAADMAKAMLPSMLESTLKTLVTAHEANKTSVKITEKPKGKKRGRPRTVKVVVEDTAPEVPPAIENPATQVEVS